MESRLKGWKVVVLGKAANIGGPFWPWVLQGPKMRCFQLLVTVLQSATSFKLLLLDTDPKCILKGRVATFDVAAVFSASRRDQTAIDKVAWVLIS